MTQKQSMKKAPWAYEEKLIVAMEENKSLKKELNVERRAKHARKHNVQNLQLTFDYK